MMIGSEVLKGIAPLRPHPPVKMLYLWCIWARMPILKSLFINIYAKTKKIRLKESKISRIENDDAFTEV